MVLDAMSSAAAVSAVSQSTTVLVGNCTNSQEDEANIEYFNQVLFEDEWLVNVVDTGTTFQLAMDCPQPISPELPASLSVTLAFKASGGSTPCDATPLVVPKASMDTNPNCNQAVCTFTITASNSVTGTVYSTTLVQIALTGGTIQFIPELEPATLPICNHPVADCLTTGTCSLSTSKVGAISLCSSGSQCTNPTENGSGTQGAGYGSSYNSNVYFQTSVADKVT